MLKKRQHKAQDRLWRRLKLYKLKQMDLGRMLSKNRRLRNHLINNQIGLMKREKKKEMKETIFINKKMSLRKSITLI